MRLFILIALSSNFAVGMGVDPLKEKLGTLKTSLQELKNKLNGLQGKLGELQGKLGTVAVPVLHPVPTPPPEEQTYMATSILHGLMIDSYNPMKYEEMMLAPRRAEEAVNGSFARTLVEGLQEGSSIHVIFLNVDLPPYAQGQNPFCTSLRQQINEGPQPGRAPFEVRFDCKTNAVDVIRSLKHQDVVRSIVISSNKTATEQLMAKLNEAKITVHSIILLNPATPPALRDTPEKKRGLMPCVSHRIYNFYSKEVHLQTLRKIASCFDENRNWLKIVNIECFTYDGSSCPATSFSIGGDLLCVLGSLPKTIACIDQHYYLNIDLACVFTKPGKPSVAPAAKPTGSPEEPVKPSVPPVFLNRAVEHEGGNIVHEWCDGTMWYYSIPDRISYNIDEQLARELDFCSEQLGYADPGIFRSYPEAEFDKIVKYIKLNRDHVNQYKSSALFDIVNEMIKGIGVAQQHVGQAVEQTRGMIPLVGAMTEWMVQSVAVLAAYYGGYLEKSFLMQQIELLKESIKNMGAPVFFDRNLLADIIDRIPEKKLLQKEQISEILKSDTTLKRQLSDIVFGERVAARLDTPGSVFQGSPNAYNFIINALDWAPDEVLPIFILTYLAAKLKPEDLRNDVCPGWDKVEQELNNVFLPETIKDPIRNVGDICVEENQFIDKRQAQKVVPCLHNFVDKSSNMLTPGEIALLHKVLESSSPKIGVACSGGGCRAQIATLGFVGELKKMGLFDAVAYMTTLSGSTWMLFPYLAYDAEKAPYDDFVNKIKQQLKDFSRPLSQEDLSNLAGVVKFHSDTGASLSLVDFYGFLLYRGFLAELPFNVLKLSSIRDNQLQSLKYPFPIATAVGRVCSEEERKQAKTVDEEAEDKFWWHEFSPYEVGSEQLGVWTKPEYAWANFDNGAIATLHPEPPLWYLMGTWGSAFAIDKERLFLELNKKTNAIQGVAGTVVRMIYSYYKPTIDNLLDPQAGVLGQLFFGGAQVGKDTGLQDKDKIPLQPGYFGNPLYHVSGIIPPLREQPFLQLTDAGHKFNLPVPPLLRRRVNLHLICDASGYGTKDKSDLPGVIRYAELHDYPFPLKTENIRKESIGILTKEKPIIMFNDDPKCPVVVYVFSQTREKTLKFFYSDEEFDVVLNGISTPITNHADAIRYAVLLSIVYKGLVGNPNDADPVHIALAAIAAKIKQALTPYRLHPNKRIREFK